MKMNLKELKELCDSQDSFSVLMDYKNIDWLEIFVADKMEEVEVELTLEEARKYNVIKSNKCCSGGPQWGHAWNCPTLPG